MDIQTASKVNASVCADRKFRVALARRNHYWFFHIYLKHFVKYPTASFQREIFNLTQFEPKNPAVITAFRGSAKSTIANLSNAIWAMIGIKQTKFVVILSQTQSQAKLHLANIKRELETNELLISDFGPFEMPDNQWSADSLVLPRFGCRIMAASYEQSIRGLRHGQHRPDLIICDDVEDSNSVKTKEGRDKTYNWLTSEVIPAGDTGTKIIIVGNILHEDSLMTRLKDEILHGKRTGIYREYPIIDDRGKISWRGKFPDIKSVDKLKNEIGSDIAWHREYLLHVISDSDRVIHPDWIKCYDKLPVSPRYGAMGVDLAISKENSADYTAIVSVLVAGWSNEKDDPVRIYVLPNPINQRLDFSESAEMIKAGARQLPSDHDPYVYVEDFGYQKAMLQMLDLDRCKVKAPAVKAGDKRTRLALTSHLIKTGTVLFPKHGCEELINQLVNFATEKHDDLADAFAIVVNSVMAENNRMLRILLV